VKGELVATSKAARLIAFGAFAAAAAAGPVIAASVISTTAPQDYQALPPGCRSHFGNPEDNICLDGPDSGNSFSIGSPWGPIYGPKNYNSGPLLPGQTWTNGVN
jgi:hypothetical protein